VVGTSVFHLENCPMGEEIVACQSKGGEGDKDSRGERETKIQGG